MMTGTTSLAPGDAVEIKYRLLGPSGSGPDGVVERWIRAHVVLCEPGTHPLVRLADGQMTEIRPFMRWRLLARAASPQPTARAA